MYKNSHLKKHSSVCPSATQYLFSTRAIRYKLLSHCIVRIGAVKGISYYVV